MTPNRRYATCTTTAAPTGSPAAQLAAVRPQTNVEDVLELGQGDQVGPRPAAEQVLDGTAGQAGLPAHLGQRPFPQRVTQRPGDGDGVAGGDGRAGTQFRVGKRAGDMVDRRTFHTLAPHHSPDATNLGAPTGDGAPQFELSGEHLAVLAQSPTILAAWRFCVRERRHDLVTPDFGTFVRAVVRLGVPALAELWSPALRVPAQNGTMRPGEIEQAFEPSGVAAWWQSSSTPSGTTRSSR
jgi:hypothetical protein